MRGHTFSNIAILSLAFAGGGIYSCFRQVVLGFKAVWVPEKARSTEGCRRGNWEGRVDIFAAILALAAFAPAAGPTTRPAKPAYIDPGAQHDQLVADLESGDDARASAALASIHAYLNKYGSPRHPAWTFQAMRILLDARRFSDLDSAALADILKYPADTARVASMQKLRAQAFLASGDSAKALSTAKAYYDVAPLKDTADAIDTVSLCIAAAHPDDAPAAKAGEAAESVARAIRAQSGCVAPANAYILSLQGAK
jgi:hypothetical protein